MENIADKYGWQRIHLVMPSLDKGERLKSYLKAKFVIIMWQIRGFSGGR